MLTFKGDPAGTRTRNLPISNRALCPVELRGQYRPNRAAVRGSALDHNPDRLHGISRTMSHIALVSFLAT